MNRLDQLYQKLGLNKQNGLVILSKGESWIHKFPYRVGKILSEVIRPDAFFCLFSDSKINHDHPKPFNQGFIFFFDNPTPEVESLIHTRLINFGLAMAVFIDRRNTLDLYHGSDFSAKILKKIKSSEDISDFEDFSFTNQINGNTLKALGQKNKLIDHFLLTNITDARRILIASDGLKLIPQAANRLIGRLLFISYLIDRNVTFGGQKFVVGENKAERRERFKEIILKRNSLYAFFTYLNERHHGDMFPLKEVQNGKVIYDEINIVRDDHLEVLYHLFNCSQFFQSNGNYKGYQVQKSLFDLYDFEIIPVELISSIYENFIGNKQENQNVKLSKQKEIKAYYTPPYLVDYVLSQTVAPFLQKKSKRDSNCRVLDPACGSGIFLVETLRKIIEKERLNSTKSKVSDTKLWKLIKDNLFGIDIDSDAIEITIFSLYVTILDYKKPAEIEKFKFQKLIGENLFGNAEADFFNTDHVFNKKIKDIDFIIGNPPWGTVESSRYLQYISSRNSTEKQKNETDWVKLEIGDKEICQAFMIRTSDFVTDNKTPSCCFIVSSKVLYNGQNSSKTFRNYLLQKFSINQVVELSPVNNKIRGGNHIFEHAKQPAAVISFVPQRNIKLSRNNVVQHITVKPNKFFIYYKTIVIEKHDVKTIKQEYFMEKYGGYDWLWKVLVHGNVLDIHFLKRLKQNQITLKNLISDGECESNGGLKLVDGDNKYDTSEIFNFDYFDAETGFRPYSFIPQLKWKKYVENKNVKNGKIGYLPDINFFKGDKLLIKKGIVLEPNPEMGEHHFQGVSAFSDNRICFTATVCSIKPKGDISSDKSFLPALSGLFNSKFFTYYLLNTSTSAGIERSRINFDDFFKFPLLWNKELGDLALSITNQFSEVFHMPVMNHGTKKKIESEIYKLYKISDQESALIDFALEISLPILLREHQSDIFKPLGIDDDEDKKYLKNYIKIILLSFKQRFKSIGMILNATLKISDYFIRIDFSIANNHHEAQISKVANDNLDLLVGDLGIYEVCKQLYFQQDVRGFTDDSFYIIKPNEKKLWHQAVAYLDALEFEEEITKAEINRSKKEKI